MLRGKCFVAVMWILSLGLSFAQGDCFGAFVSRFVTYCHATNVAYNDKYARYYVSDSGYIHEEVGLGNDCFVNLVFQVPGFPDLNSIDSYIVVGDSGTIVGDYPGWAVINSPTAQNLWSVCGHDFTYYYAVGDSGTIAKSTDEGETWFLLQSPTTANLYSVECWGDETVHIYGEGLTGYRSTDGGGTWTEMDFYGLRASGDPSVTSNGNDLYTSFFLDQSTGYAFGAFGIALQTTDSGSTWRIGFAPDFNRINTAYFTSVDSGVVAGDNGTVRFTTDGGQSWFEDSFASSLTPYNINHIEVNETDSIAVIVGDSGTVIFVATDSTLLSTDGRDKVVPRGYELSQNYPNPFNPQTDFKFQTSPVRPGSASQAGGHYGFVTLEVYDVLGRKVSTIVNEGLPPGVHTARWDATNAAGGVYFYRLIVNDSRDRKVWSDVRKMLLIK